MFSSTGTTAALLFISESIKPFVSSMGLTATIILIILLITRELAAAALENLSPADFPKIDWACRVLNISIVPFFLIFAVVMVSRIMSVI